MGSSVSMSSLSRLCLALLAALLVVVPVAAFAEEPTREEYVREVDLICQKNEKANSRILNGVKKQVTKKHELVPAGKRFIKASSSFGRAVTEIAAVPQPIADQAKLKTWIKDLQSEKSQLLEIGKALKSEKTGRANKLAVDLQHTNRQANNTVFSFEFKYCDREIDIS